MATLDSLQSSLSRYCVCRLPRGYSRRDDTVAYCGLGTPGTDSGLLITEKQDMECIRDQLLAFWDLTQDHPELEILGMVLSQLLLFPSR